MCGIAGILLASDAQENSSLQAIGPMTRALRHRGPDGEGFWQDRPAGVALGHRRLAVVDLSEAASQPMLSSSGRFVLVFNGEIYNYLEIRRKLQAQGQRFGTGGDTETMLDAIEAWGLEAALREFAGMFAFALWDRRDRRLHLARDRLGKKPLYLARLPRAIAFASELKGICANSEFDPHIDIEAAATMLARGFVPDQNCIWKEAFKLRPGSLLTLTAGELTKSKTVDDLKARTHVWWSLAEAAAWGAADPLECGETEMIAALEELLALAVRERMIADVPVGAFLSGGIDSATVVALMQAQSRRPVRTFTISFDESGFDESAHAAQVARHLGTDHAELALTSAAARRTIPELPQVWDEPFADESQIPTLLLTRLARQHVTVALSGDGGDECFAGYSRHIAARRLPRLHRAAGPARRPVAGAFSLLARAARRELIEKLPLTSNLRHALRSDRLERLAFLLAASDEDDLYARLAGAPQASLAKPAPAQFRDDSGPNEDLLSRILYEDAVLYLPGDILVKADRASMANSLETRCPLLDHRVVEFSWRLPPTVKIRNGQGKWILRRLLGRHLPQRLVDRPKQGFDVPIGRWLREPLRVWAGDVFANVDGSRDALIDADRLDLCWKAHLSGAQDHSRMLWSVLMFEAWRDACSRMLSGRERLALQEAPSLTLPRFAEEGAGPSGGTGRGKSHLSLNEYGP